MNPQDLDSIALMGQCVGASLMFIGGLHLVVHVALIVRAWVRR